MNSFYINTNTGSASNFVNVDGFELPKLVKFNQADFDEARHTLFDRCDFSVEAIADKSEYRALILNGDEDNALTAAVDKYLATVAA